ncbi:hypothetical protein D7M15_17865 [Streptomyces sp. Z26]|nr:hypothetical protein D7M15_17865 [Streptomyces sp. Z26]
MARVVVRGGRHVHAVRVDEQGVARTACGSRRLRRCDHPQYADEPVTCPNCPPEAVPTVPVQPSWPDPETAYATAPNLTIERIELNTWLDDDPYDLEHDYFLRRAALTDRIALLDPSTTTNEEAEAAALMFLDTDSDPTLPGHAAAEADPRGYTRQQYARWTAEQRHAA